jgi:ligand-binding sensor domain-containing protein
MTKHMNLSCRISLIILFLVSGILCPAQVPYLKHFTVDEGLPSNEVYQVEQDAEGYLWAATDRGAVRYDGYSFEHVPLRNGSMIVPTFGIYKSTEGNLLFSGFKGHIYSYKNNHLKIYSFSEQIASLYKNGAFVIADAFAEHNDSIWVSYNTSLGVLLITPGEQKLKLKKPDGIYFDLTRNFFYTILDEAKKEGSLQKVFITWPDGTTTLDTVRLSWKNGYIRKPYFAKAIGKDFFSIGRKVLVYNRRKRVQSFDLPMNVFSFSSLDNRQLFVGYQGGGAVVYNLDNEQPTAVSSYLDELSVTCIYQDVLGGTWFSTLEDGLFYQPPSKTSYWQGPDKITFIEGYKGDVYVGYPNGFIRIFREGKQTGELRITLSANENVINCTISSSGDLFIVTNRGLYRRHNNSFQFFNIDDIRVQPADSNLLFSAATVLPELHKYKLPDATLIKTFPLPNRIISMMWDSKQRLWIGSLEGLYRYEDGVVKDLSNQHEIFSDRIVSISELNNGSTAVGSLGSGIAIIKNDSIHSLNIGKGIALNTLRIEDNRIWAGTNKGVVEISLTENPYQVRHYGSQFGFPTSDIQKLVVSGSWIYFKWLDNLVTVDVDLLKKKQPAGHVTITGLISNGKQVSSNSREFPYNQNDIRINYNNINFVTGNKQQYRYTLNGFEKRWHYTTERQAQYTNVPPGNYKFHVQVADAWGNFIDLPATNHSFSIKPAFWQTWWFLTACIISFLLLSLLLVKERLKAIRRKNQMALDLAENQQKALVQLINPHFVFNVLNTAQAAILNEDKLNAASIISRFAKLMRLTLDLSKDKFVPFLKEIELLEKYLELEMIRVPGKFTYKMTIDPQLDTSLIHIPSMLIQPFIENAIKHGIMHLPGKGGYISINLSLDGKSLVCIIDDNGVGREKSAIINANKFQNHHSVGMEITKRRLQLLHHERKSAYFFKLTDKKENGETTGTKIEFSIPYNFK